MNTIHFVLLALLALLVNADRSVQGNLLTQNTVTVNGHADGLVTINLGPFGSPPTLKVRSDLVTDVGVRCKTENSDSLPPNLGISILDVSGYAAIEITSSNPDARCEYELITIDLTSFFHAESQISGIMCRGCGHQGGSTQSSTGIIVVPQSSTGVDVVDSSTALLGGEEPQVGSWDCPEVPGSFWDWRYAPPNCEALTVIYPTDLPSGQANDVNVRIYTAQYGDVTLNFHNNVGFWSGETTFTFLTHPNFPLDVTQYSVEWVQVGGSNCHWTGNLQCGNLGAGPTEPSSSSTGMILHSSTGVIHGSTGLTGSCPLVGNGDGDCWESIPCESKNGQLVAKLVHAATYVFVNIEKIQQVLFNVPCDIIAGIYRTYEMAVDFAVEFKSDTPNQMQCQKSETTNLGNAEQRHRDCGEDMGHFYQIDLAAQAEVESVLVYKYTEEMLTSKGKCAGCGKYLRWACWDAQDSKWKFPQVESEVDEDKKECRQKTNQLASTWAVVYAEDFNNSTFPEGTGHRNGATGITATLEVMTFLMLLSLYLIR